MPSLTIRRIETSKPSLAKDIRVADGEGLYLKVARTGTKTFTYRYTYAGRGRKEITLGTYPTMGLADAREERLRQAKVLAAGKDPLQEKRQTVQTKKEAPTVDELIELFYENWLKVHYDRPDDSKAILTRVIGKPLGKTLVPDVTKKEVTAAIHAVVMRGKKVMANRALTLTRNLFTYAVEHHHGIEESPVTLTRKAAGGPEKPKKVNLSFERLAFVMKVLDSPEVKLSWQTRMALRLGIATAKRPFEVVSMEWSHVNFKTATWLNPIHLTKEQRDDHLVFLNSYALTVLREAYAISGKGTHVFPAVRSRRKAPTHLSRHTLSSAILDLFNAGVFNFKFTPHNFRHTFSSRMPSLGGVGGQLHIVEKALDHLMEGTMAIYNDADYLPERQAAMTLWGKKLIELDKENEVSKG